MTPEEEKEISRQLEEIEFRIMRLIEYAYTNTHKYIYRTIKDDLLNLIKKIQIFKDLEDKP